MGLSPGCLRGAGTEGRSAYGRGVWMQGSRPQIDKTLETLWLLTVFLILFGHGFAADVSGSARRRPGVRDRRRDCMSHVSMLDWRPTPMFDDCSGLRQSKSISIRVINGPRDIEIEGKLSITFQTLNNHLMRADAVQCASWHGNDKTRRPSCHPNHCHRSHVP